MARITVVFFRGAIQAARVTFENEVYALNFIERQLQVGLLEGELILFIDWELRKEKIIGSNLEFTELCEEY